jgi:hypothetical protein
MSGLGAVAPTVEHRPWIAIVVYRVEDGGLYVEKLRVAELRTLLVHGPSWAIESITVKRAQATRVSPPYR